MSRNESLPSKITNPHFVHAHYTRTHTLTHILLTPSPNTISHITKHHLPQGPALRSWLSGIVSDGSAEEMLSEGVTGDDFMDFEEVSNRDEKNAAEMKRIGLG